MEHEKVNGTSTEIVTDDTDISTKEALIGTDKPNEELENLTDQIKSMYKASMAFVKQKEIDMLEIDNLLANNKILSSKNDLLIKAEAETIAGYNCSMRMVSKANRRVRAAESENNSLKLQNNMLKAERSRIIKLEFEVAELKAENSTLKNSKQKMASEKAEASLEMTSLSSDSDKLLVSGFDKLLVKDAEIQELRSENIFLNSLIRKKQGDC